MKRIFYAVLVLTLFYVGKPVLAEESRITYNNLPGIVYNQTIDGELKSNNVTLFQVQDRIAYCIEPGVAINEKLYDYYYDWSISNTSDELKERIEKIGYYGYEYPGHQTEYYYIAAQELIWKEVRPDIEVKWTTEKNLGGLVIDVSKEKEEIMRLVDSHSLVPSFSFEEVGGYVGDDIVLTDTNNVLDNYEVSESKYHKITREGNSLRIKLNENVVGEEVITLTRKYYDNAPLLIYSRGNSQKLAALRITMDNTISFKISNKEKPEIVSVPNTGIGFDVSQNVSIIISGFGLVFDENKNN